MDCGQITSKGECPICFRIPRGNIFQCVNGHSLCDLCSTQLQDCPMCRSPGVQIRNLLAESLLDEVKFQCCWNQEGCNQTMLRGELTAHEDKCDQNPDIMKLCSFFGRNCEYKFTPSWLSIPENCTEFTNHMKTSHEVLCVDNVEFAKTYYTTLPWNELQSLNITASKPDYKYIGPNLFRFKNVNRSKEQLFFRIVLLKVDNSGNKIISWAFVCLTSEETPIVMKLTINDGAKSKMVSYWGSSSLPTQSWTVKAISFKEFMKMVQTSQDKVKPEIPYPFSLPMSFLSEYYASDDGRLKNTICFAIL